jgi:GYF domain 2
MAADWFYTTDRQQMGPVSWSELCHLAESGTLKPNDMVWTDGMPEWVKAISQPGLFAARFGADDATSVAESNPGPPPTKRRRDRDEDVDDDDRDIRRPRRKRRAESGGMSAGVKVGLLLGAVVAVLIFIVCAGGVVLWLVLKSGPTRTQTYHLNNLAPGVKNMRQFNFQRGTKVVITVDSNVTHPATDVDLFVVRGPANNNIVASDQRIVKDCHVEFVAEATDSYRVFVDNLGPGMANCKVTITEN